MPRPPATPKFVVILQSLSPEEKRAFDRFVHSPYHNSSSHILIVYLAIKQALEGGATLASQEERERLWSDLYQEKPYNDAHLRKLLGDLSSLSEEFLVVEKIRKDDPLLRHKLLLDAYHERGLEPQYESAYRRWVKLWEDRRMWMDEREALLDLEVEDRKYHDQINSNHTAAEEHFLRAEQNLDYSYFMKKLKYLCEAGASQNIVQIQPRSLLTHEVLRKLTEPPFSDYLLVRIFGEILRMQSESSDGSDLDSFLDHVQEHRDGIRMVTLQSIFNFAQNLAISRINANRAAHRHYELLHRIYSIRLQDGSLLVDGFLPQWDYRNAVNVLLNLEMYDEARLWIDDLRERLRPEIRENAVAYNLAALFYAQKDFKAAREHLREVVLSDAYYGLDSRSILMKSYLESQDYEPLFSLLESYAKYLRRNKTLSSVRRRAHLNRLKIVGRFAKVMTATAATPDREALQELRDEVIKEEEVTSKAYLLDQIERAIAVAE